MNRATVLAGLLGLWVGTCFGAALACLTTANAIDHRVGLARTEGYAEAIRGR
jgi:hypothetical protein